MLNASQATGMTLLEARDPRSVWEHDLVRRVQSGDQMAFRDLVESHQSKVYSVIYGILRNREDAEDIAQQVFTKVYFAIASFDGRSSLLTWIYKIAVNECYSHLRKKRLKVAEPSEQTDHQMASADSGQPAVDTTLAQRDLVNKLLARIPEEDRLLLLWKEVEGYSIRELAKMTRMNESTVKIKLFRARQKLLKAAQRLAPGCSL